MRLVTLSPIGLISSCYREKFGIPRQPNLVTEATAEIVLNSEFDEESVRGLEGFSHIWVTFVFNETQNQGWKPLVRPPRLGGNTKVGIFASRSTFRPNPVGLSVVRLLDIEVNNKGKVILHLGGCDLLDKTPVLDIKPYLPYVDSIPNAIGGYAKESPDVLYEVFFTEKAINQCKGAQKRLEITQIKTQIIEKEGGWSLEKLIKQILQLDPRPSYQKNKNNDRIYAMKLYDFDLKWQYCDNNKIKVTELVTGE